MPLISEDYREQNRALHAERADYGISGKMWCGYVQKLVEQEGYATVLDYGCGKGRLAQGLPGLTIAEYDPAIEGKDAPPAPAELVVCTDVLEHIEPVHLNAVLRHLAGLTTRKLFFNIATRESGKTLADGRNSHLIIKPGEWWREKLAQYFRILLWQDQPHIGLIYGEAIAKPAAPLAQSATTSSAMMVRARRPVRPEWATMIEQIRVYNHRYSDAFGRLNTFSMWEGVDDKPADMQIVVGILEHVDDVDLEMRTILKFAQKAIMAMVALTPTMPEQAWRRIFEKYLRIGDFHVDEIGGERRLVMVGSPMVGVMGITATGAVASDDRWEQLRVSSVRVKARVQAAPAHERRAILACYGPSLRSTIDLLRREREETGAAVISVSGSHDFLLENGIKPDFHVECDPRPHKADNIDHAVAGVQYLIGSSVHPVLLDKLLGTGEHDATGMDVKLWHISTPEHASRIIDELGDSSDCLISGGGSVGLRAIPLLYALGYRDFSIYAMDCSFSDDGKAQWAGKHAGKRQDMCEVLCGERLFCSSPVLLTYATGFFETIQRVSDVTFRLYGDGLLQSMVRLYENLPQVSSVVIDEAAA